MGEAQRGGFTGHMAEHKRRTGSQRLRDRESNSNEQVGRKDRGKKKSINLSRNSRFIREHINANSCKQMHGAEPAPQEEVVFNRNDDPFLG